MIFHTFPEHLKEFYQIIFKLIHSNSGELKKKKDVTPLLFSMKSKNVLFPSSQRSRSENSPAGRAWAHLSHQLCHQHGVGTPAHTWPLGAAQVLLRLLEPMSSLPLSLCFFCWDFLVPSQEWEPRSNGGWTVCPCTGGADKVIYSGPQSFLVGPDTYPTHPPALNISVIKHSSLLMDPRRYIFVCLDDEGEINSF